MKPRLAAAPLLALFAGAALTLAAADPPRTAVGTRTLAVAVRDELTFSGQTGGLVIRDATDPVRPTDLSWLPLPGAVRDVQLSGSLALLAAGSRGLVIVDIDDPRKPVEIARLETDGVTKQIVRSGRYAFVADGINGLLVVDLQEIESPRVVTRISTRGNLRAVALHGELLAVAEGHGGARVFDVHRMSNPIELRQLETQFSALDVCWIGETLFVAAGSEGTAVYRPRSSKRPERFIAPIRAAQYVACDTELLAISNLGSAIQIVDGETRKERARMRVHRSAPIIRATFDGSLLWIAADSAGLGLLDLSDPAAPQRLLPRKREVTIQF